jgi:TPR repeat protein
LFKTTKRHVKSISIITNQPLKDQPMNQLLLAVVLIYTLCSHLVKADTLPVNPTAINTSDAAAKLRLEVRPADLASPKQAIKDAADSGDVEAQVKLGLSYLSGDGGYLDYTEAAKWFKLAAIQGNAQAQEHLGSMYAEGLGVMSNKIRAAALLTLSAESGRASANLALDDVSKGMTAQQLIAARKMAHDCKKSKLKGCF